MTAMLVIDVGTTGLRAAIIDDTLAVRAMEYRACPPSTPAPGLVEFDGADLAAKLLEAARTALAAFAEPVVAVGITNQRASTLVWDRTTGEPVAPGLGWQDLRTVGECIMAKLEHGWSVAPNQSSTKAGWLLANTPGLEGRDLCVGTIDSWIAWTLSEGALHVSDQTNASATTNGLRVVDGSMWAHDRCAAFGVPESTLPSVVDSVGVIGHATALDGAPPIAAMLGDQQASLIGQSCVKPGRAKITFGTGGMLDLCTDTGTPSGAHRHAAGTYPLPLWSRDGEITWGVEAIMLSAGTNVEWLRDDLGLIDTSAQSHDVAAMCDDTDGVIYVPALLGLGTPKWDYGARGTLLGITRGTGRPHVVRAVLEGIAHRGADLIEAARTDSGVDIHTVRIDGGMSANPTFAQALANAANCPIEVSPVSEATTIGAGFMAGLGVGVFDGMDDLDALWRPAHVVEPADPSSHGRRRERWADALERAGGWHPDLSALEF
ncbi:MAG TPA: FGGY family carbohydrate kinase [Ilumatobacteraceae bacterium]|nr:FGGY family carbohydrate kinase [Ilumatobacteraceae bacterium]